MSKKPIAAVIALLAILVGRVANGEDNGAREVPPSSFPVLSGIGAALSITDTGPRIFKLLPGSAAEKCGKLTAGDRILTIRNGDHTVDVKGKQLGNVVSLIRGPVGTTVTLEILREASKSSFRVTLKREAVAVPGLLKNSTYDALLGKAAPTVKFSVLGQPSHVRLSDYAGQIVVLDFWASWCGTCYSAVDKMQEIARSHPEWRKRVVLLTATIDTDLQAASKVVKTREWKETIHLSIAPEKLEAMNIAAIPAVIILSPDGKIAAAGDPHSISIENEVSRLLLAN